MATELKMPAFSPTMERGTLARWRVEEGDRIGPGDVIAEIETNKATMELEAADAGVIAAILIPDGTDEVAVGAVIALIGAAGEAVAPRVLEAASSAAATPVMVDPLPEADARTPISAMTDHGGGRATPLAHRIATIRGLSLLGIAGTGARGRIVKADLGFEPLTPVRPKIAAPAPAPPVHAPPEGVPFETVRLSAMRRTIARRLAGSKQTAPHFYLTAHVRIDALLHLREELNASLSARGIRLSVNDLVIKALALALVREPDANVQFAGDEIYRFGRADIAMAVAIEGGLVTPVIRDAASLSLSAIAGQARTLAARARDGKLMPEDHEGGTASLSNLGMYGIDEMIPVLNPPQALILGVGSGVEKPWKVDGAIALATIMAATASFDHRAIDGAAAARFMAALRDLLEQPIQLLC